MLSPVMAAVASGAKEGERAHRLARARDLPGARRTAACGWRVIAQPIAQCVRRWAVPERSPGSGVRWSGDGRRASFYFWMCALPVGGQPGGRRPR